MYALLSETWREVTDDRGESGQEWRRISSLLGESGANWVEDPVRHIEELTDREFDVFILLGRGLSNQRISTSLYVTERTVKSHVTRILAKLRLDSRLQAGLVAQAYTHWCRDQRRLARTSSVLSSGAPPAGPMVDSCCTYRGSSSLVRARAFTG
ncbi:response regulator transcription factor [Streptomyces phaeoluteigriseus]